MTSTDDFLLIELPQLVVRAHDAELLDRFRAQIRVLLGLRRGQQPLLFTRDHEGPQNPALDVDVGGRGVDLGEHRAAFRATHHAEILDRLVLKLRTGGAACEVSQYLARFRRVALREHEHRLRSQLRRGRSLQQLLEKRHGLSGSEFSSAIERQQLQVFVVLVIRIDWLTRLPPDLHLERLCLFQVAALRIGLGQFGDRRQRFRALAEAILRVGLPVESAVGPRPLHRHDLVEAVDRSFPSFGVQLVAGPVERIGLPIALPVCPLLLTLLLLASALLGLASPLRSATAPHRLRPLRDPRQRAPRPPPGSGRRPERPPAWPLKLSLEVWSS